jgi:PAS domain S-box-containing protein
MSPPVRQFIFSYGLALVLPLSALGIGMAVSDWLLDHEQMLVVVLSVVAVAGLAGRGPGLVATLAGTVAASLLLPPKLSFYIDDPGDVAHLAFFPLLGAAVAWAVGNMHRAVVRGRATGAVLRQSEARFRAVIDQTTAFVGITDITGRFTLVNPQFCRVLGYSQEELLSRRMQEITHPEDLPHNLELFQTLASGGPDFTIRKRYLRKDGGVVWVALNVSGIREDGSIRSVLAVGNDISAEKAIEETLTLSESRFRLLVDQLPLSLQIISPEGKIVRVNRAWEELYGVRLDQLRDYNMLEDPQLVDKGAMPFIKRAFAGETVEIPPVQYVVDRGKYAGEYRWTRSIMYPLLNENRSLREVVLIHEDITARKDAEDQLRRSHDTFYNLIQNTPFGVYVIDADFRLRQASLGCRKVFANVHPLIDRDFAEVIHIIWPEPFASAVLRQFRHTLETGEPFVSSGTIEQRHDTEQVEAYDWRIERITLPDGRHGVVCYFYDLSERMRWEDALRASDERLRMATQAGKMGIWDWDIPANHVTWTDSLYLIHGLTKEQFSPTVEGFASLVHPQDAELVTEALGRSLKTGAPYELTFRSLRPDGETVWLYTSAVVLQKDGRPDRMLGATVDVTELKRAEEELRRNEERLRAAKEEAEAASRAKDQFLATLSHELRNPLNPVLLTAGDMLLDPSLAPEAREAWEIVRKNIGLEAALIDDLLDLTRITQGKVALNLVEVDVHEVLQDAINTVRQGIKAKRIDLKLNFTTERPLVTGDRVRLRQVFWNVLNNAVKFTDEGGTITVATAATGDQELSVTIGDTGIGMSEHELERVFDAFQQGHHAEGGGSHRYGGLGLGLAITRQLVRMHGGEIRATSPGRGEGSVFELKLPLTSPTGGGAGSSSSSAAPAATAGSPGQLARPLRIMLVEDHEHTRDTLKRLLTRRGHDVAAVATVAEARAIAATGHFDLLLSDLGLPDGDGHVLMEEMRALLGKSLRGIAISGYGMAHDVQRSLEVGFQCHLTKPVQIQALDQALLEVLAN